MRDAVALAVNTADLEGLLDLGAPGTEYTNQIDALTGLVLRGGLPMDAVAGVWEDSFGPESAAIGKPAEFAGLVEQLEKTSSRWVAHDRS
ncbi:hypothetical protein DMP17_44540 [Pseudonocardia sp. TMWB2A]|uniref:hypothetical protein n=1 Tax=Pseudonocardia sp. TMWB2A TaxID=687430 RepID=UPI00307E265D